MKRLTRFAPWLSAAVLLGVIAGLARYVSRAIVTETPMFSDPSRAMVIIVPLLVGFALWAFWSTRAAWKLRRTGRYDLVSSLHVRPSHRSSLLAEFPGVQLAAVEPRVPISVDLDGMTLWRRGLPLREVGWISFESIVEPIVAVSIRTTYGREGAIHVRFRRGDGSIGALELIVGSPSLSGLLRASDSGTRNTARRLESLRLKVLRGRRASDA